VITRAKHIRSLEVETADSLKRGTLQLPETLEPLDQANYAESSQFFDLLAEDNRLNVYAGKLEVRPPGAPTTNPLAARKPPRPGTHAVCGTNRKGLVDRLRISEGQC